jgi:hypothetical protein
MQRDIRWARGFGYDQPAGLAIGAGRNAQGRREQRGRHGTQVGAPAIEHQLIGTAGAVFRGSVMTFAMLLHLRGRQRVRAHLRDSLQEKHKDGKVNDELSRHVQ